MYNNYYPNHTQSNQISPQYPTTHTQNNYRSTEASAAALRLAIINLSPIFNSIATDEAFANNLVSAIETGDLNKINELIKTKHPSQQCSYSLNNGFCCIVSGKQVCINFIVR